MVDIENGQSKHMSITNGLGQCNFYKHLCLLSKTNVNIFRLLWTSAFNDLLLVCHYWDWISINSFVYLEPFNAVLYSQLKLITDFRETYLFIQPLVTLLSTLISSFLALNAIPWPHYWVCCCGVDISVWMTRLSLIPIHATNDTNCTEEHKIPHTSIVSYICLHLTFLIGQPLQ